MQLLSPEFHFTTNNLLFKNCRKMSLKGFTFCNVNIKGYEQLTPIYDNVSATGTK